MLAYKKMQQRLGETSPPNTALPQVTPVGQTGGCVASVHGDIVGFLKAPDLLGGRFEGAGSTAERVKGPAERCQGIVQSRGGEYSGS